MIGRKFWLFGTICFALSHSFITQGQVKFSSEFSNSRIRFIDGRSEEVNINSYLLFAKNQLVTDQTNTKISISTVKWIEIDSIQYAIAIVGNTKSDSIRVMEPIILGTVSLYRSPRLSGKSDLFVSKDNKFYHLRTIKKYVTQRNLRITQEYIFILRSLMADCTQNKPIADNLSLNIKSIQNIVLAYNTNCGQLYKSPIARKKNDIKFQGGLLAGYSFSNPDLLYGPGGIFVGESFLNRPFVGVFARLNFGKFSRAMLSYDLVYENLTGEGNSLRTTDKPTRLTSTFNYDISQIRNQLALNVKLLKRERVDIYAGIGFSLQYQLSNNSKRFDFDTVNLIGAFSAKSDEDVVNISPMFNLGLGTRRFEIRYQLLSLVLNLKMYEKQSIDHRISLAYKIFK